VTPALAEGRKPTGSTRMPAPCERRAKWPPWNSKRSKRYRIPKSWPDRYVAGSCSRRRSGATSRRRPASAHRPCGAAGHGSTRPSARHRAH
jgi:hypothetical protein